MTIENKLRLILIGSWLLFFASVITPCPAKALLVTIDFDSLPAANNTINGNIDGVNLDGVTITSADGLATVITGPSVSYMSPFNAVMNSSGLMIDPLVLIFDELVSNVSLTGGDSGVDLDQFSITAFGPGDQLLGSVISPVFGGNVQNPPLMLDNYRLSIDFPNIKRVEVKALINYGILIDDLEFKTVPEPSCILLLSSVLVGLFFMMKCVKSKLFY